MEQSGLSEAISIVNTRIEFSASKIGRKLSPIETVASIIGSFIGGKKLFVDEEYP